MEDTPNYVLTGPEGRLYNTARWNFIGREVRP
jgi:hypothetical protein